MSFPPSLPPSLAPCWVGRQLRGVAKACITALAAFARLYPLPGEGRARSPAARQGLHREHAEGGWVLVRPHPTSPTPPPPIAGWARQRTPPLSLGGSASA